MANQIAVVGAGVMGEAFIAALIRSGAPASSISAVVRRSERGDELVTKYSITVKTLDEALRTSDVVLLGIKPQGLADLMPEIAPHLRSDALVISLLAGKTIAAMSAGLGGHQSIARVMPNTPTLIGKGMAGYSLSAGVTDAQKKFVQSLLASTGKAIEIPEDLQNALTGTSGSGPAYFFRFVEAMVDGAVAMGLSKEDATTLTIQTIVGSAALLERSGDSPTTLREKVTSPNGTTAAALASFSNDHLSEIVARAMKAARDRSQELA